MRSIPESVGILSGKRGSVFKESSLAWKMNGMHSKRGKDAYTKIHGLPPSEADMKRYFRVSPPAVHQMILNLEARGFIEGVPRTPRSVRLMIPRSDLPDLE